MRHDYAEGNSALVSAWMAKHYTGVTGCPIDTPLPTTTARGTQNQMVAAHLISLKGTSRRMAPADAPMPTVTGQGLHVGEVRAFLMKYYGTGGQLADCRDPMHTVTSKGRMGLVTIAGEDWQIIDIGMRMLTARELFRAHSFPEDFIIDPLFEGKPLTKTDQVAKVGNSVARRGYRALLKANFNQAALVAA